jgi:hypothetical protein
MNTTTHAGPPKTQWSPIRRGDGKLTGYVEVYYFAGQWMTIPGVSRFRQPGER